MCLEDKDKSIHKATLMDTKVYEVCLVTKARDSARHHIAEQLKRLYRFLYRDVDPKFKQVYGDFEVKHSKELFSIKSNVREQSRGDNRELVSAMQIDSSDSL